MKIAETADSTDKLKLEVVGHLRKAAAMGRTKLVGTMVVVLGGVVGAWGLAASGWRPNVTQPVPATYASAGSVDLQVAAQSSGIPADKSAADAGWPNLFGPQRNSVSGERGLNPVWPESGPPVVWRASVGEGYSSPIAAGDDVVVFHRPLKEASAPAQGDLHPGEANHGPDEVVSCFDAATGQTRWEFRRPTSFRCKTHYSSGPYSTPILAGNFVYACGTEGNLYCLNRADGSLAWQRELWKDYGLAQKGYFPVTGSPLLVSGRLILNLGAKDAGAGIIALDAATGETLWQATDHEASYATPCAATIHGREFVFVFTPTRSGCTRPADWQRVLAGPIPRE